MVEIRNEDKLVSFPKVVVAAGEPAAVRQGVASHTHEVQIDTGLTGSAYHGRFAFFTDGANALSREVELEGGRAQLVAEVGELRWTMRIAPYSG